MLPVGRNRAESGQRERDLWPRGNTAPETTLLSGYGVDTLRWADNVRGTPGQSPGSPRSPSASLLTRRQQVSLAPPAGVADQREMTRPEARGQELQFTR